METLEQLTEKAAALKPAEKLILIEAILSTLDAIDPQIETEWINESEARYSAYLNGELQATDHDEVMKRLRK